MTPEQFVAVVGALSALLLAVTGLFVQLRELRKDVNGRLTQLLALTERSARAEGHRAGRAGEDGD